MSLQARKKHRMIRHDNGSYWTSFSDLLSSMLLVFMLALVISIYQYYSQLDIKTKQLDVQKEELNKARVVLASQKAELETSRVKLMGREEELASVEKALAFQALQIKDQQVLRKEISSELSKAMSSANLDVKVNPTSGDIVLESQILFKSGQYRISTSGKALLDKVIPLYLEVLTRPQYIDYLTEILIEGHTDSEGSYMSNLELSQNLALAVAEHFLKLPSLTQTQLKLLSTMLTAKGRSSTSTIKLKDGKENVSASRRVVIRFGIYIRK